MNAADAAWPDPRLRGGGFYFEACLLNLPHIPHPGNRAERLGCLLPQVIAARKGDDGFLAVAGIHDRLYLETPLPHAVQHGLDAPDGKS